MFKELRLLKESFLFAFKAITVNKLRTFLSLLGISIGIFIIISVFTAVDSLENNLKSSIESLGSDVIYVSKWPWTPEGDTYAWWDYLSRPHPTEREYELVKARVQQAEGVVFMLRVGNTVVKFDNFSAEDVEIIAPTHDYEIMRSFDFQYGRYFSQAESERGVNVVILGNNVSTAIFSDSNPIGKYVVIKGMKLKVIGVLAREGESIIDLSIDNNVIIPFNFVKNVVNSRLERFNPSILIKADKAYSLNEVNYEMIGVMRSIRKLKPGTPDNFSLNKTSLITNQMTSLFDVLNMVGTIIGGFSILVGGFGIANIMFVSVKERTTIIGIQKALGAKKSFILFQFLFESVVLSVIGGLMGLLMVFLLVLLFSQMSDDFQIILSTANIVRGVGISALIGILSGSIPAWFAAKMDPVEAIRSNT